MNIKNPTLKEKLATPVNEEIKIRALQAKAKLPKSGVTSFFLKLHPEYDTKKNRSLLNNVLQGRCSNLDITEKLEVMTLQFMDVEASHETGTTQNEIQ